MAPDRNTWVREKGPSLREEGIVYSDYMGSGLGNKPSHGGNGYKIGSMVATVLSRLGLGLETRRDQESCAYARAEQKQSDFEKAKGSVDEGQPVYESKKRVAARGHTMVRGEKGWWKMEGARGRTKPRWRETERKEEGDMTRGREIRGVASLKIMGMAILSSGKWGCPIVTRQIIRRVIEMVGVPKYYGSLQFNIGWQWTPPETPMLNTIDRRREFSEENGKKRETHPREKEKKERREKEKRERERGHTNGLISQQCDLFALYSHKEPTLLCHYVTKEGVIAQQGPPVRLLLPNLSTIALKESMIHEWPEATSNPVSNQESWRRRSESGCADRFINAYWKQVGR
ncbi:hypothetical protein ALC53_09618 [Atta colombica]|uniref:Uncharacterized protein n=1 Tax=Atta colombica TaxID=520822 RepID=A0A151I1J8_9HYME|nr:hypothetical protein ALC53_09618 [Atta colombica]